MALPSNWDKRIKEILGKAAEDETGNLQFQYYPPYDEFFPSERIASWAGFERWISKLNGSWCFRGQRDAEWILTTSLDRAVRIERETDYSKSLYHLPRLPIERQYLFRFYQQAQNWGIQLPEKDDLASWLGLMQHYGVPTRLLDWTTSPYVAAYFAIEYEPPKNCAIWAVDLDWLQLNVMNGSVLKRLVFPPILVREPTK